MRDLTKYVGIPYEDKGKDPAVGLDCWQLVRHFYACELGIALPDYFEFYNSALNKSEVSAAINRALPEWFAVGSRQFGDVLIFRITDEPWHTAVAVDDGKMLHTSKGHASVIEPVNSIRWRDRYYGAYRWKS